MRDLMRHITYLLMVAMMLMVSCSSYEDVDMGVDLDSDVESESEVSGDDDASTLSKGFSSFDFNLPLLERFQGFVEEYGDVEVDVEVYMRGRTITDEYTLSATMCADRDSLYVNAVDQTLLAELYHQDYFVNYMVVTGVTRSSDDVSYPEGAMVIGALLSASDPDDMYFVSTFTTSSSVSGSGTEFDPYIITNLDDFQSCIVDKIDQGDNLEGVWFLQGDHLNFLGSSIGCVGSSKSQYFAGHYDGGMMTISQLILSSTNNVALFYGIDSSGVFCNTIFDKVTIAGDSSSGEYCGVVAAHCKGGTIAHVFVESGCSVSGYKYIGGLFGSGFGYIYNSTCRANVTGYAAIGGLAGGMNDHDTESIKFQDCVFGGTVVATDHCAGGVIGYANIIKNIYVVDTYVSGTVYAAKMYTGGVIGSLNDFDYCCIKDVYLGVSRSTDYDTYINGSAYDSSLSLDNNSNTTDTAMWYVGGVIGHATGNGSTSSEIYMDNAYFKGTSEVTGQHCIGGALGYAKDLYFYHSHFYNYVDLISNISSTSSSESYVGGVIGYCSNVFFNSCYLYNYGDVTTTERYAGGLIGYYETTDPASYYNLYLYNYGNVSCASDNVGGCIGILKNSVSNSSYLSIRYVNYGCVSGVNNVGGFVGIVNGDVSAYQIPGYNYSGSSGSAYNVVISGASYVGGLYGKIHTDSTTPNTLSIYGTSVADVSGSSIYTGGIIGGIYNDHAWFDHYITISFEEPDSSIIVKGGDYTGGLIGGVNVDSDNNMLLTVKNVDNALASTSSVTGSKYTGGVVGGICNVSSFSMSTCSNVASVSGTSDVGGLLGGTDTAKSSKITISDSYNDGEVSATGTGVAGIIGFYRSETNNLMVSSSCNTGKISTTVSDKSYIGGILGDAEWTNEDSVGNVYISGCYNSGSIEGTGHRGGLIGRSASHANISSCFNIGAVESGGTCVAGLVGSVDHEKSNTKITFQYCYNTGVSGYGILGGEDGMDHDDCSYSQVYFLISASGDDIDLGSKGKYNATGYTESQMATPGNMSLGSLFTTPSDMSTTGNLPYLTNVRHYVNYPKVSL